MASFNSSLFLSLLVLISAFMAAPSAEAQIPLLNSILKINGTVLCAINGTGSSLPSFPNATMFLRGANTTLARTTTTATGTFNLVCSLTEILLMQVLSGPPPFQVVVMTPLSTCNPTLPPVGNLAANVTRVVIDFVNGLNLISPVLSSFQFILN